MNSYRLLKILKNHKIISLVALLIIVVFLGIFILFKNDRKPFSSHDNKLNILLLGSAGKNYSGGDLTDTIMLVNIDPPKNQVVLISIPRDLYLSDLDGKINTAYVLGEEKKEGGGLVLAKSVVSKITGEQIDYAARIDFSGFTRAIDLVGGVDVEVENDFQDLGYPVPGRENDLCGVKEEEVERLATSSANPWEILPCRFEHLRFEKGKIHIDGETALKFVRSRNAQGLEGTDFARSRRQQKGMVALKDKLVTTETLLNPIKLVALYKIISTNIDTDIPLSRFDDFFELGQKMKDVKVRSAVIDYGEPDKGINGLLINPPLYEYGAWVLIPRVGGDNFSEIHEYVKCQVESGNCPIE